MASSKDYLMYVLELLRNLSHITYKKMMGEYILYKDGVIFGGIYDNRFLVKNIEELEHYHFREVIPYKNAKKMLLIDIEDADEIEEIVKTLVRHLS